jgi:hypothetical protein
VELEQLGKRVDEHPTENDRRRRTALGFLIVAAVGLGLGVPWTIWYFAVPWGPVSEDPRNWSGSGMLPGGLVALGAICLCFAVVLFVRAAQTRGERFEVYEQGLVHRRADAVSVIRWSDLTSVHPQGAELTGGPHMLGIDFRCVLRLADGRRLVFNSYTTEATMLAEQIDAAVNHGTPPQPGRRWPAPGRT